MPQFQLEVAIALVVCAACSIVVAVVSPPADEEAKIKLPTHAGDEAFPQSDPFDVTKPEDLVDGTPVKPDVFWGQVCLASVGVPYSSILTPG